MTQQSCLLWQKCMPWQNCNFLGRLQGELHALAKLKIRTCKCCALQRSQSVGGKLEQDRHYEKCSRRFEVPGRAGGRHSPVPDFQQLHAAWNSRLADCKAVNRSKSTKPEVLLVAYLSSSNTIHAASCHNAQFPYSWCTVSTLCLWIIGSTISLLQHTCLSYGFERQWIIGHICCYTSSSNRLQKQEKKTSCLVHTGSAPGWGYTRAG